jgi:hypothetical protein
MAEHEDPRDPGKSPPSSEKSAPLDAALCNLRVLCGEESHYQRFEHELDLRLNQSSGSVLEAPDDLSLGELFEEIRAQIEAELQSPPADMD